MEGVLKCPLFKGMSETEIHHLLKHRSTERSYKSGELLIAQGEHYRALIILESGMVRGEMCNDAGEVTVIEQMSSPKALAPAFLFATDNRMPVNVIAEKDTVTLRISSENFVQMLQESHILLTNYLRSTSDRSQFLTDRLRLLRFGTIKSKIASYLLEQSKENHSNHFTIIHTQQELADMFGVTRPALARGMGQLVDAQLISVARKEIEILDKGELEVISKA